MRPRSASRLVVFGVGAALCALAGLVVEHGGVDPAIGRGAATAAPRAAREPTLIAPRPAASPSHRASSEGPPPAVAVPPNDAPVAARRHLTRDPRDARRPIRFVVLSDLHVLQVVDDRLDPPSMIPPQLPALIGAVPALEPEFVVITGDLTSGERDVRNLDRTVRRWWDAVTEVLQPLSEAGIPVLPVPGNHDLYRPEHRLAYAAWADLPRWLGPMAAGLRRDPNNLPHTPFYYAVDYEYLHLSLLEIPDRHIEQAELAWLRRDLAATDPAAVRLAFGHVPLRSVIGSDLSNRRLLDELGTALVDNRVAAYFAGHEHVVWDEVLRIAGRPLRQVISGVGGAVYRFPLNAQTRDEHCRRDVCVLPTGGYQFPVRGGRMVVPASCVLVEVGPLGDVTVRPYQLVGGVLVPFERAPFQAPPRPAAFAWAEIAGVRLP